MSAGIPLFPPVRIVKYGGVGRIWFSMTIPVKKNPLKRLFLTQTGGEKRGYPSTNPGGAKWAFNIDNSANPMKSK
jgi:hypothetical protein